MKKIIKRVHQKISRIWELNKIANKMSLEQNISKKDDKK